MTIDVLERNPQAATRLKVIDCDIHPTMGSLSDLNPWLA